MDRSQRSAQARRELDRKFRATNLGAVRARPHAGWVKAIRNALGMSQAALARRLGVTPAAVGQLERAEVAGGVTLAKLGEVAAALECTLVYALVPNTTLEDAVQRQAYRVAREQLGYVGTTMALEDQGVSDEGRDAYLEDLAQSLVDRNHQLWRAE
jgi:predicted DNA-binding mobile mystery protein A